MLFSTQNREKGFTLTELLIAMALSGIILGTIAGTFIMQRKTYDIQEQITEMVQTARASIDMMSREIRMAGHDPTGAGFDGITYDADQLQIKVDIYKKNNTGDPDGDTLDSNENIIYKYYDEHSKYPYQIKRKTGNGTFQPFAENIKEFKFDYLDSAGNATTTTADIRQIRITITSRTAKPDPNYSPNGGYRTYTLTSLITPRNLDLE
ncbi:MAG: prepilin-type N-terminal cleavage/methylation domain-containing protein [Desulfobacteraceae bacterium]|nr:prepilin-type N-terminal cleavage/methylation domain-containing protein [Desulfobacteraceae bacterium]